MRYRLIEWTRHAWEVLNESRFRILWNSFLAIIPLLLSVWLFRRSQSRSLLWWIVFLVFIAFLPNAPYILTDIIHVINFTRLGYSVWTLTLLIIPQYILFILIGVQSYVISLINFGYYLHRQGLSRYILAMELSIHALCSVGIYLGRFRRFNSWDFVTQPTDVIRGTMDDLTSRWPVLVMVITFLILTITYWIMKQITLSLILWWRYQKKIKSDRQHAQEQRNFD